MGYSKGQEYCTDVLEKDHGRKPTVEFKSDIDDLRESPAQYMTSS